MFLCTKELAMEKPSSFFFSTMYVCHVHNGSMRNAQSVSLGVRTFFFFIRFSHLFGCVCSPILDALQVEKAADCNKCKLTLLALSHLLMHQTQYKPPTLHSTSETVIWLRFIASYTTVSFDRQRYIEYTHNTHSITCK